MKKDQKQNVSDNKPDKDQKSVSEGTGSGQSGGAGGVRRSQGPQDTPDQK